MRSVSKDMALRQHVRKRTRRDSVSLQMGADSDELDISWLVKGDEWDMSRFVSGDEGDMSRDGLC